MDQGLVKWNRLKGKYKLNVRDWRYETDGLGPEDEERDTDGGESVKAAAEAAEAALTTSEAKPAPRYLRP